MYSSFRSIAPPELIYFSFTKSSVPSIVWLLLEIQWCIRFVPRLECPLIAIRLFLSVRVEELTKKDASKEKVLTQTQRARFDTIFPNYHERFRPRVPAGTIAAAQNASNATNELGTATTAAAVTTGAGDGTLPRTYSHRMPRGNLIDFILGKEERTPSDSQSNASERPMVEIKKQKTQK